METTVTHNYAPPVDQLLALGDASTRKRPDYASMGFGPEHVPELIRMSTDPALIQAYSDSDEVWAPIHAWRVLGMLRAVEAVEPLLALFEQDDDSDWTFEELPAVFAQIGAPAVAPLVRFLEDRTHDTWARVGAVSGLVKIARTLPGIRAEIVATLARILEDSSEKDDNLNGSIVARLMDLGAVEAAPAMERAFAEYRVDPSVAGDWEDVQVDMGLIPKRLTPRRYNLFGWLSNKREPSAPPVGQPGHVEVRQAATNPARAAAKRKAQKAASRKSRGRK